MEVVVPEKSDGDGVGGKRWRREKAEEPEKAAEAKRWRYQRKAPEKGGGREAGKEEMGTSERPGRAESLRKQVGERSERDFASARSVSDPKAVPEERSATCRSSREAGVWQRQSR